MSITQDRVAAVQDRVFKEQYYDHLWCIALIKHNMSTATIDQHEHTDKQLISMVNTFWELLPDHMCIRTGPFFEVCDIAASDYTLNPYWVISDYRD